MVNSKDIEQRLAQAVERLNSIDNPSSSQLYYLAEFKGLISNTHDDYKKELSIIDLLVPIRWDMSTSVPARKHMVLEAMKKVNTALPFLSTRHAARAAKWIEENKHRGLWD